MLGATPSFPETPHYSLKPLLLTREKAEAPREDSALLSPQGLGPVPSLGLLAPALCLSGTLRFLIFISLQIPVTTRVALSAPI